MPGRDGHQQPQPPQHLQVPQPSAQSPASPQQQPQPQQPQVPAQPGAQLPQRQTIDFASLSQGFVFPIHASTTVQPVMLMSQRPPAFVFINLVSLDLLDAQKRRLCSFGIHHILKYSFNRDRSSFSFTFLDADGFQSDYRFVSPASMDIFQTLGNVISVIIKLKQRSGSLAKTGPAPSATLPPLSSTSASASSAAASDAHAHTLPAARPVSQLQQQVHADQHLQQLQQLQQQTATEQVAIPPRRSSVAAPAVQPRPVSSLQRSRPSSMVSTGTPAPAEQEQQLHAADADPPKLAARLSLVEALSALSPQADEPSPEDDRNEPAHDEPLHRRRWFVRRSRSGMTKPSAPGFRHLMGATGPVVVASGDAETDADARGANSGSTSDTNDNDSGALARMRKAPMYLAASASMGHIAAAHNGGDDGGSGSDLAHRMVFSSMSTDDLTSTTNDDLSSASSSTSSLHLSSAEPHDLGTDHDLHHSAVLPASPARSFESDASAVHTGATAASDSVAGADAKPFTQAPSPSAGSGATATTPTTVTASAPSLSRPAAAPKQSMQSRASSMAPSSPLLSFTQQRAVPKPAKSKQQPWKQARNKFKLSSKQDKQASQPAPSDALTVGAANPIRVFDHNDREVLVQTPFEGQMRVLAGTLEVLVDCVYREPLSSFSDTFLLTFRLFATPADVLELLINRYCQLSSDPSDVHFFADMPTQLPVVLMHRIASFVKTWATQHYYDFAAAPMPEMLARFIEIIAANNGTAYAESLSSAIDAACTSNSIESDAAAAHDALDVSTQSTSISDSMDIVELRQSIRSNFDIMHISTRALARQITLRDWAMFKAIRPVDLVHYISPGPESDSENGSFAARTARTGNLTAFIQRFNQIGYWVGTVICSYESLKQRTLALGKLIRLAQHCFALGNFNATMAILSGLNTSPVLRLKKTFAGLSPKTLAAYKEIENNFDFQGNYRVYREIEAAAKPPIIPFFGLVIKDLSGLKENHAKTLPNGLINFEKHWDLSKRISKLIECQSGTHALELQDDAMGSTVSLEGSAAHDDDVFSDGEDASASMTSSPNTNQSPLLAGSESTSSLTVPSLSRSVFAYASSSHLASAPNPSVSSLGVDMSRPRSKSSVSLMLPGRANATHFSLPCLGEDQLLLLSRALEPPEDQALNASNDEASVTSEQPRIAGFLANLLQGMTDSVSGGRRSRESPNDNHDHGSAALTSSISMAATASSGGSVSAPGPAARPSRSSAVGGSAESAPPKRQLRLNVLRRPISFASLKFGSSSASLSSLASTSSSSSSASSSPIPVPLSASASVPASAIPPSPPSTSPPSPSSHRTGSLASSMNSMADFQSAPSTSPSSFAAGSLMSSSPRSKNHGPLIADVVTSSPTASTPPPPPVTMSRAPQQQPQPPSESPSLSIGTLMRPLILGGDDGASDAASPSPIDHSLLTTAVSAATASMANISYASSSPSLPLDSSSQQLQPGSALLARSGSVSVGRSTPSPIAIPMPIGLPVPVPVTPVDITAQATVVSIETVHPMLHPERRLSQPVIILTEAEALDDAGSIGSAGSAVGSP
ncbi:hypothetical protein BC831DRAFT_468306 [Entophlyctis helioformis]|nr:hypothetical protein BC831DRAFT_468306 [Entophlyctis helioformis]